MNVEKSIRESMMANGSIRDERLRLGALAKLVVASFVAGSRTTKNLLPELRAEVLYWLPKLLGNPPLLEDYVKLLRSERRRQGVHEKLLVMPIAEIPIGQIAATGFNDLDNIALGELVLCPDALETLQHQLCATPHYDHLKGDWFYVIQETSPNRLGSNQWEPPHVTIVQVAPRTPWRKWFGLGLFAGVSVAVVCLLLLRPWEKAPLPGPAEPPIAETRPFQPVAGVGKLKIDVLEHEMMRSSHPATPYRLKIETREPVYLMHVFCWRSASAAIWFPWHGEKYTPTISTGRTEVQYPDDPEKRKFQGFASYLLVFTSVPVDASFWAFLEYLPREKMPSAKIEQTRDYLYAQLQKAGIPPEKIYIFGAIESTIVKE